MLDIDTYMYILCFYVSSTTLKTIDMSISFIHTILYYYY